MRKHLNPEPDFVCSNCGEEFKGIDKGSLVITSIANGNQKEETDASKHGKKLCKDCALQIQHDIFHMIYDL